MGGEVGHVAAAADELGRAALGVLALEEARRGVVDLGELGLGLGGLGPAHVLLQGRDGDDGEDAQDRDDDHELDERETLGVLQLLDVDLLHASSLLPWSLAAIVPTRSRATDQ